MNKKIVSLLFLLIIFVSIAFAYIYLNQDETDIEHYDSSENIVDDEDLANELDDIFIEEDDEIEIGDIF